MVWCEGETRRSSNFEAPDRVFRPFDSYEANSQELSAHADAEVVLSINSQKGRRRHHAIGRPNVRGPKFQRGKCFVSGFQDGLVVLKRTRV